MTKPTYHIYLQEQCLFKDLNEEEFNIIWGRIYKSYFKDDWVTIFDGKKKTKSYKQKTFKPEDLLKGVCLIQDDD